LPSVKDRIGKVMSVTIGREVTRLESSLGFLATVGVNATFIGLFGTVWGIMNSFRQIAASHDTSLAVVAPGIAEALFATAMGLLAAIPASAAYNHIADAVGRIASRLERFSDEFSAILSRQLDEKAR
jgi:biopolymer transport protein TolQ